MAAADPLARAEGALSDLAELGRRLPDEDRAIVRTYLVEQAALLQYVRGLLGDR